MEGTLPSVQDRLQEKPRFLEPPQGQTSLRAPTWRDTIGDLLNAFFGVDPTTDTGPQAALKTLMTAVPAAAINRVVPRMVRLWRGEGPIQKTSIWRDPEMSSVAGRWFTESKELAEQFARDNVGKGRYLKYVDVPQDLMEASRAHLDPKLNRLSNYMGKDAIVLPEEWAARAKRYTQETLKRLHKD